jgi:hypothetical protein
MESTPSQIDELLSGMLDGVLSEEEVRELDIATLNDPSLEKRLELLRKQRTALLAGRSRGNLGPDFAKSISAQAKLRAREMGTEAPSWLVPGNPTAQPRKSAPATAEPAVSSFRPWIYGLTLATSAIFVFLIAYFPFGDQSEIISRVSSSGASVESKDLVAIETSDAGTDPKVDKSSSQKLLAEQLNPSVPTAPSTAITENVASPNESILASDVAPAEPTKNSANWPANETPQVRTVVADANTGAESNLSELALSPALVLDKKVFFTFVMDVTVDSVALESHSLEAILEKYGIVYAEDLNITSEQLKSLEDSRLVGVANGGVNDKMGVMFLRSTTQKLGLAMQDIIDQYKDFPEFSLDMTTDTSVGNLVKQLSGIQIAEGTSGIAHRLSPPRGSGSLSPFVASVQKPGLLTRETLKKSTGSVLSKDLQEISNVLLLLRASK